MTKRAGNSREQGWLDLKEWLAGPTPRIRIFAGCSNLIVSMQGVQCDERRPGDCAGEPHYLTHGPDALRYFVAGRPEGLAPRDAHAGAVAGDGFAGQTAGLLAYGM